MFNKKRVRFWRIAKRCVELQRAADRLTTEGIDKIMSADAGERAEAVEALQGAARLNAAAAEVLRYARA